MLSTAASLPAIGVILVLTAAAVFFLELLRLRRPDSARKVRMVQVLLLCLYLLGYLYLTIFSRKPGSAPRFAGFLWSYREAFRLENGGIRIARLGLARQILMNVLLYVPLGMLLPGVCARAKRPYWLSVALGAALTLFTECTQYALRLGLFEPDDILDNMLGLAAGILVLKCLRRAAKCLADKRF